MINQPDPAASQSGRAASLYWRYRRDHAPESLPRPQGVDAWRSFRRSRCASNRPSWPSRLEWREDAQGQGFLAQPSSDRAFERNRDQLLSLDRKFHGKLLQDVLDETIDHER